jgi:hypothetical protein
MANCGPMANRLIQGSQPAGDDEQCHFYQSAERWAKTGTGQPATMSIWVTLAWAASFPTRQQLPAMTGV